MRERKKHLKGADTGGGSDGRSSGGDLCACVSASRLRVVLAPEQTRARRERPTAAHSADMQTENERTNDDDGRRTSERTNRSSACKPHTQTTQNVCVCVCVFATERPGASRHCKRQRPRTGSARRWKGGRQIGVMAFTAQARIGHCKCALFSLAEVCLAVLA